MKVSLFFVLLSTLVTGCRTAEKASLETKHSPKHVAAENIFCTPEGGFKLYTSVRMLQEIKQTLERIQEPFFEMKHDIYVGSPEVKEEVTEPFAVEFQKNLVALKAQLKKFGDAEETFFLRNMDNRHRNKSVATTETLELIDLAKLDPQQLAEFDKIKLMHEVAEHNFRIVLAPENLAAFASQETLAKASQERMDAFKEVKQLAPVPVIARGPDANPAKSIEELRGELLQSEDVQGRMKKDIATLLDERSRILLDLGHAHNTIRQQDDALRRRNVQAAEVEQLVADLEVKLARVEDKLSAKKLIVDAADPKVRASFTPTHWAVVTAALVTGVLAGVVVTNMTRQDDDEKLRLTDCL